MGRESKFITSCKNEQPLSRPQDDSALKSCSLFYISWIMQTMLPKGAVCLLLLALSTVASAQINTGSASSRFYLRKDRPPGENRRSFDVGGAVSALRREAAFDPDVLNRFLEEYASKIKRTTEKPPPYDGEDDGVKAHELEALQTEDIREKNATAQDGFRDETTTLNDTIKRHKFYNANSHEDRNSGWVTLEAIPWSKSKISKWQANPTTQGPWPDSKPWDKPSFNKPWNSDFPRPSSYESSSKPWQKKPHWSDNSPASSNKPWYSQDRPRPGNQQSDRPSYPAIDKYEDNPSQAQKWPPERPSWDRYGDSSRPSSDIITDDGPPNFPSSSWDRPGQRPSYTHHTESYVNEPSGWHDRNDFPSHNNKFGNNRPSNDAGYYDRPHFSHYQYPSSNEHPSNHPSSGDGQWVLLSTNRGYSKSRQRSIKLDALVSATSANGAKSKKQSTVGNTGGEEEEHVPAVTSKRQVRLTVLPSINGTNTTTSHGGLLEVERTFKTVDQSQKEYEMKKSNSNKASNTPPLSSGVMINRRPIRNTITGSGGASSSAVLAAVGAGMLPATMAMMIPMMLGRKKREAVEQGNGSDMSILRLPKEIFEKEKRREI